MWSTCNICVHGVTEQLKTSAVKFCDNLGQKYPHYWPCSDTRLALRYISAGI